MLSALIALLLSTTSVGGLVVSAGDPPPEVVEGYADFNANAVMLWESEEAGAWAPWPAVAWATEGPGQVNDPTTREELPLEAPAPNVVGFQVGDEPQLEVPDLSAPLTSWTNFSYWAPIADGSSPDPEPRLDAMLEDYSGAVLSVSEYNLEPVRLHVLGYFREKALELGVPYWQYLNAYAGWETGFEASHERSDLAWSAYTGQAYGYTGHWWFAYYIDPAGHPEATQGGGSILHELGGWTRTETFADVAEVNAGLLHLAEALYGGPVDWRSTAVEVTPELVSGEFGPWVSMHVNNTYAHAGTAREVELEVEAGFEVYRPDGSVEIAEGAPVTIPAGEAVVVRDPFVGLLAG